MRYVGLEPMLTAVQGVPVFANNELRVTRGAIQAQAFASQPEPALSGYTGWSWYGRITYDLGLFDWECARQSTYGAGCTGSNGTPALATASLSRPVLGSILQLHLTNLAWSFAFVATGLSDTIGLGGALPLPLSGLGLAPGCNLLCSVDAVNLVVGMGGTATHSLSIPMIPAFAGVRMFHQAASLDPAVAGGFAVSNGVATTLGH